MRTSRVKLSVGNYEAAGYSNYKFENEEEALVGKIELHLTNGTIMLVDRTGEFILPVSEGDNIEFFVEEGQPVIISGMNSHGVWHNHYWSGW